jgi:phosphate transport system substrate-binding protein
MKAIRRPLTLLLGLWLIGGVALGEGLVIQGSDTMVGLTQKWVQESRPVFSDLPMEVNGGGTGTGIAALLNRTADIATCSRKIRAREVEGCVRAFGARPREYAVALDAVIVLVHASNQVEALDLEQLAGIYSGRIRNWKEVGGADVPLVPYGRENGSGTHDFFKESVLKRADFAGGVQLLQGTAQILSAVARDPNAIGYGTAALTGGTRRLRLARSPGEPPVEADMVSVHTGRYPLSRSLYLYLPPALDAGRVHDWIDWIRGAEGQRIAKSLGYFPLNPEAAR